MSPDKSDIPNEEKSAADSSESQEAETSSQREENEVWKRFSLLFNFL